MFTRFHTAAGYLLLIGLVSFSSTSAVAQILVGISGSAPDPFTNAPVSKWATLDPFGQSNTYGTPESVDSGAQAFDQVTIATALPLTTGNSTARVARYNTNQSYLVTQPEGVSAVILKATLLNVSGYNISSMVVSYDFGVAGVGPAETAPGQRVYFSLSGQSNTWQLIPAFSGLTNATNASATLSLGAWTNDTDMYLLWLDDNAQTNPEGIYTIDNFAVSDVRLPESSGITAALNPANGEVAVQWFGGTLVEATELLNGGTVWTNVPGNPISPYKFTPAPGTQRFFAVRL